MKSLEKQAEDWETAFEEGMRARLQGLHLDDCPYKSTSTRSDGWKRGFLRQNMLLITGKPTEVNHGKH